MMMKHFLKYTAMTCAVLSTAVLMMGASSCNWNDVMEEMTDPEAAENAAKPLEYVVSIHSIVKYPRAEKIEQSIPSYFGGDVCINKNYLLHSKEIEKIEILARPEDPGFYDLILTLTPRGVKMWIGLSVGSKNSPVAFVIDGMYYRSFIPIMLNDDNSNVVQIKGLFDSVTAMRLKKNAERNFKKLSD